MGRAHPRQSWATAEPRSREHIRFHTQFFLKQSCEQKKLPLSSIFRHVGHCSDPASFSQSFPRHFFLAGGSVSAIFGQGVVRVAAGRMGGYGREWSRDERRKVVECYGQGVSRYSFGAPKVRFFEAQTVRQKEKRFAVRCEKEVSYLATYQHWRFTQSTVKWGVALVGMGGEPSIARAVQKGVRADLQGRVRVSRATSTQWTSVGVVTW